MLQTLIKLKRWGAPVLGACSLVVCLAWLPMAAWAQADSDETISVQSDPDRPSSTQTEILIGQLDEFGKKISVFRWLEDYSYLGKLDRERVGLEKLKYVPLGETSYVSFGGEYRFRWEGVDEPIFDLVPIDGFDSRNHRIFLHADLHVNKRVRVFAQFASAFEDGRLPGPRPFDRTDPDIQQLFADIKFGKPGGLRGLVRVGRQELPLGGYPFRISAPRLSTNLRQSFDAVKVVLMPTDKVRVQAFYAKPLINQPGFFDDPRDEDENFWGVYVTTPVPIIKGMKADWYYLGRSEKDALYNQGVADETRHSLGARFFGGTPTGFSYNVEGLYQFGSFGDGNISAWAVASDFSQSVPGVPLLNKIGLSLNAASGDKDPDDDNLQTFNALFPNLIYFSEATALSPTNAYSVYPYVDLKLQRNVKLYLGSNILWRQSSGDTLYRPIYIPITSTLQSESRYVGQFAQAQLYWWPFGGGTHQFSGNVQVRAFYVRGISGNVFDDAGGRDFNFGMLELFLRL